MHHHIIYHQKKGADGNISGVSLNIEKRMPSQTLPFLTRSGTK